MLKKRLHIILIILFSQAYAGYAQTEVEESNLKAAFIYNFTHFIEWESPSNTDEFIIGIIENSPIEASLKEIAKAKTINNKKIRIQHFDKIEEIQTCQILFIPKNATISLKKLLNTIDTKNILIISEKDGYAMQGANINFVIVDNKLKFEANPQSMNLAGLKASSQLLKLAIIVN